MPLWIETDAAGRDVLVDERTRSRAARLWDWGEVAIGIGCGLGILWIFASIVVLPAFAGRPPDLATILLTGVMMLLPGTAFVVLGVLSALRGFPRTRTTREVLDEDALEMLADYPDDFEPKRLAKERGLL